MSAWVEKMKAKWGLTTGFQVFIICVVFSLAGSSIMFIRPVVWRLFGFGPDTSAWIRVPTYILFIFPTYQIMLLVFGTLFGQFRFFWAKEKALFRLMTKPFRRRQH
jgi:hypothetical protein